MVFEWRNYIINKPVSRFAVSVLAGLIFLFPQASIAKTNYSYTIQNNEVQASAVETKNYATEELPANVLKGSVSVEIKPYCENWTSADAFNAINRIGTKLALANNIDNSMKFVVVEKEDANASTDINNKISIYKGLLKYVETEDELAFVIGHEMGHVAKTHVKKSILRKAVVGTAGVAGSVLSTIGYFSDSAKMARSGLVLVGSSAAGGLVNKKLSRGQETKADRASIDYLVNAGYNPLATISILNKISGNYFDFFSDHPSGEKRIKDAYKYIQTNYPQYIKQGYDSTSYERALRIINNK